MKRQKKYKAQGFYIDFFFEYLCLVTLGDGGISSSFVVVRIRGKSFYSSYAIKTTPKKIQLKQRARGNICFVFFPPSIMMATCKTKNIKRTQKQNLENVEKLEVLGNFRRKNMWRRDWEGYNKVNMNEALEFFLLLCVFSFDYK
jgi:hypothetical protein